MQDFDWLFGDSRVGWLKTALLSGILGLLILGVLFPAAYTGVEEKSGNQYIFILLGYPVLVLSRRVYWRHRANGIQQMHRRHDPRLETHLRSVKEWNEDLWFKLILHASSEGVVEPPEHERHEDD